jgi:hypothetical protein
MVLTRSYPRYIGPSSDGTPVAQEPQDEQTDQSRLLLPLSSLCLGFMSARDVIAAPHVATPVVVQPAVAPLARTHFNKVLRYPAGPTRRNAIAKALAEPAAGIDGCAILAMTLAHLNDAEARGEVSPRVPLLMAIRDRLAAALREDESVTYSEAQVAAVNSRARRSAVTL